MLEFTLGLKFEFEFGINHKRPIVVWREFLIREDVLFLGGINAESQIVHWKSIITLKGRVLGKKLLQSSMGNNYLEKITANVGKGKTCLYMIFEIFISEEMIP